MAALLLRFEVAAAGFGVLFAVTAVLVCVLLALRARTQRKHDKQITDVKVRWSQHSHWFPLVRSQLWGDAVGQISCRKRGILGAFSIKLPCDVHLDAIWTLYCSPLVLVGPH